MFDGVRRVRSRFTVSPAAEKNLFRWNGGRGCTSARLKGNMSLTIINYAFGNFVSSLVITRPPS